MAQSRSRWHPRATSPIQLHPVAAADLEIAVPTWLLSQYSHGHFPARRERRARLRSTHPLLAPTATSPVAVTRHAVWDVPLWAMPSRVRDPRESLSRHDRYSTGSPDSPVRLFPARVGFYFGILPASVVGDRPDRALPMR